MEDRARTEDDAPTFRRAAATAALALEQLRDAVEYQGDPELADGAVPVVKRLSSVVKALGAMSSEFDD